MKHARPPLPNLKVPPLKKRNLPHGIYFSQYEDSQIEILENAVITGELVTKTGPDGSEIDKFKRDPLNLIGLLVAAVILTTFYFGFRAFTDHLTEEHDAQQLNSTDRTMPDGIEREGPGSSGRVREPEFR